MVFVKNLCARSAVMADLEVSPVAQTGVGAPGVFTGGRTTGQEVADHLRRLIHSGRLRPGDRLPPERILAKQLGVGRVTLRGALAELRELGYLEARRGAAGGSFVTSLEGPYTRWLEAVRQNAQELEDILDYRIAVETEIAALAARRRTAHDIAELRAAVHEGLTSSDHASYRASDSRFHASLAFAARNERLRAAALTAREDLFIPVDRLALYEAQVEDTARAHSEILEGVRSRTPRGAAAAMRDHIEDTRDQLHRLIAGQPLGKSRRTG
jgi:GntR family transcriptional repressor for pyruvate dehydrogenase complex